MKLSVCLNPYRSGVFCVKVIWTDCNGISQKALYDFGSMDAARAAVAKAKKHCAPGCLGIIGAIARMSDCPLDSTSQVKLGQDSI